MKIPKISLPQSMLFKSPPPHRHQAFPATRGKPKTSTALQATKQSRATQDHSQLPQKKQRGCCAGAANYSTEDIEALLDILEEQLPLGGKAWIAASDDFSKWAEENGWPVRTAKSLELKFKQVCS
jgi:hypothetical protein